MNFEQTIYKQMSADIFSVFFAKLRRNLSGNKTQFVYQQESADNFLLDGLDRIFTNFCKKYLNQIEN